MPWTDGETLVPLAQGTAPQPGGDGIRRRRLSNTPLVGLREGQWKYTRCALDPEQLFDLEADPHERHNLADDPAHQGTLRPLRAKSPKPAGTCRL